MNQAGMTPASMMRSACVVFFATCVAALPITAITQDKSFLWQAVALSALLVYVAAGLRLTRLKGGVIHLVQVGSLIALVLFGAAQIRDDNGASMGLARVAQTALAQITSEAPPLSATEPARLWLLGLMGVVVCITDALATTLAAPAWALAPLATPFVIASLASPTALTWWFAGLLGLAYLLLLATDSVNSNDSWTRNVNTDSAQRGSSQWGVWRMAALIGVPTLAVAVAAGMLVPHSGGRQISSGPGGPIVMQDPTINLSKDLNQPTNQLLLTYTSSDGKPQYLRMTSLTKVTANGWSLDRVSLLTGTLPTVPGLTGAAPKVSTRVAVRDFASEYLPVPYAPQSFSAPGDWSYDPASLTILSTGSGRTAATRGLNYQVTSSVVDPDPVAFSQVNAATPAADGERVRAIPANVPQSIVALTQQITKGQPTDALKANALQSYFTDSKRFHYDTRAPVGSGYQVLENFLFGDRTGYCIHFASAMALMARIAGIPSRVAVGFAPGKQVGDHFEVYTHDMHAWPELYFQSYGWVRFEPTVAVAGAPDWTTSTSAPRPSASATATVRPSASSQASTGSAVPSSRPSVQAPQTPTTHRFNWQALIGPLLWVVVAGLVLMLPFLTRIVIRARRIAGVGDPEQRINRLWRELRDERIDLGWQWPDGSVRQVIRTLSAQVDPASATALKRIGRWVEWSRFAEQLPGEPPDFTVDMQQIRHAWAAQSSRKDQFLARWLPRSLFVPIIGAMKSVFTRKSS